MYKHISVYNEVLRYTLCPVRECADFLHPPPSPYTAVKTSSLMAGCHMRIKTDLGRPAIRSLSEQ